MRRASSLSMVRTREEVRLAPPKILVQGKKAVAPGGAVLLRRFAAGAK